MQNRILFFTLIFCFPGCANTPSTSRSISSAPQDPEAVFSHPAFAEVPQKVRDTAKEIFGYRKINERAYRKSDPAEWQSRDGSQPGVRRDTHAKTHACVKATFEVNADLPEHLRVGMFSKPGAKFNAWIRFANGLGQVKHDLSGDARAISMKVMGVKGKKALEAFPDEEQFTQDIIMNNGPAFFVDGAQDAKEFFAAEASGGIKGYFTNALLNPLERDKKKVIFTSMLLFTKVEPNLLRATYWSETPYRFGDRKVQYIARPCADHDYLTYRDLPALNADEKEFVANMRAYYNNYSPLVGKNPDYQDYTAGIHWLAFLKDAALGLKWNDYYAEKLNPQNRNYLRDNIISDLNSGRDGCFELGIELFKDERSTPINRATVTWKSETQWLGRILIPTQDEIASAQRIGFCENLSFNTWHSLEEHKPLGELNQLRGMIYRAMSTYRHQENRAMGGEPLADFRENLAGPEEVQKFYK